MAQRYRAVDPPTADSALQLEHFHRSAEFVTEVSEAEHNDLAATTKKVLAAAAGLAGKMPSSTSDYVSPASNYTSDDDWLSATVQYTQISGTTKWKATVGTTTGYTITHKILKLKP